MGKSTGEMTVETLCLWGQAKRYIVLNKGKIIILTHDWRLAERLRKEIDGSDYPEHYSLKIGA
jgi:hypothetical protein